MGIELLERDAELGVLESTVARSLAGSGSVLLVSGEAGVGKTSLIRAFLRRQLRARVLLGACDDLVAELGDQERGALGDSGGYLHPPHRIDGKENDS